MTNQKIDAAWRDVRSAIAHRFEVARMLAEATDRAQRGLKPTLPGDDFDYCAERFATAQRGVDSAWRRYHKKRLMMPNERERTAHHEAGHAVAAIELDHIVEFATIIPKGNRLGTVHHYFADDPAKNVIFSLAGPIAERKFTGKACQGNEGDEEAIAKALGMLERPRRYYRQKATQLVAGNWPAIVAVAEELLRVGTMNHQQLASVMSRA